jgi:hypothetical protein
MEMPSTNKNIFFSKVEERKVKQVLSGGQYQLEGGGFKERMEESEYGRTIMYSCMKMEK